MKSKVGDIVWYEVAGSDRQQAKIIATDGTAANIELLTGPQKGQRFSAPWGIIRPLERHEPRQIIEYHKVQYLGGVCDGNALSLSQEPDPPLVYVEGYIKLKPGNLMKRHRWVFDPEKQIAYEVAQLESLKNLGVRETVPWDNVEYYGYEVTADEISETKQLRFVLSDSDLEPILEKIKASGAGS
jgi:hypothetical protein